MHNEEILTSSCRTSINTKAKQRAALTSKQILKLLYIARKIKKVYRSIERLLDIYWNTKTKSLFYRLRNIYSEVYKLKFPIGIILSSFINSSV